MRAFGGVCIQCLYTHFVCIHVLLCSGPCVHVLRLSCEYYWALIGIAGRNRNSAARGQQPCMHVLRFNQCFAHRVTGCCVWIGLAATCSVLENSYGA